MNRQQRLASYATLLGSICLVGAASAQVVRDGTLGQNVPLGGDANNFIIGEIHGELNGTNLFHSFLQFDLSSTQSATFTGTSPINNVISRVTGGPSTIGGLIRSDIPGANFFFMNPAGITFTDSAALDVSGSFHATTADYLEFGSDDNQRFYASPAAASVLSPVDVTAFGFLGNEPAPISVQGSLLELQPFQELSLVGGDIELTGGEFFSNSVILAPSGGVTLVSVGSPGEVGRFTGLEGFSALGDVNIFPSSFIDVSGEAGGDVTVIANSLLLFDDAAIVSDTLGATDGGTIFIDLQGTLGLGQNAFIQSTTSGSGRGPDVRIQAGGVVLLPGAVIATRSFDSGGGGDLEISAGIVDLQGGAVGTDATGTGQAGDVSVSASLLSLDASTITSLTQGQADTGNILLFVGDLVLDNNSLIGTGDLLGSESGTPGSITILALGSAELRGGSTIVSAAGAGFTQASGDIALLAEELRLSENSSITSVNFGSGDSGSVILGLDRFIATDGAFVTSNSVGAGNGGAVFITADEFATLSGPGTGVASNSSGSGAGGLVSIGTPVLSVEDGAQIQSLALGAGNAGGIFVNADELILRNGGQITGETRAAGGGAIVSLEVTESVLVSGAGSGISVGSTADGDAGFLTLVVPELTVEEGGIIQGEVSGTGQGFAITIDVDRLILRNAGRISTNTLGSGSAGALSVDASQSVTIEGLGLDDQNLTGMLTNTFGSGSGGLLTLNTPQLSVHNAAIQAGTVGPGVGGSIEINADTVSLAQGAQINASSFGDGAAGDVELTAGNISISGRNAEDIESGVFTSARAGGDGGDINVTTEHLTLDSGGSLSASALDSGAGGDIRVDADRLEIRDDGIIDALSTGTGAAGNLSLNVSESFEISSASIQTSATSADGGNIHIGPGGFLYLDQGRITTSVGSGEGSGGNITVEPRISVLDSSEIRADAFGGDGGNIDLNSQYLIATPDSVISASSELGNAGVINVAAPDIAIVGSLTSLPADFLAAAALFRPRCEVRETDEGSSLVVVNRVGIPASPEGLLLAYDAPEPLDMAAGAGAGEARQELMAALTVSSEGSRALKSGRFDEAVTNFAEASRMYAAAGDPVARDRALRSLSQAQQAGGDYEGSVVTLNQVLAVAEDSADDARIAQALASLGNAYIALEQPERARELLSRGVVAAIAAARPEIAAQNLNNLANLEVTQGEYDEALGRYKESARLALAAGDRLQAAKALANGARVLLRANQLDATRELLMGAQAELRQVEATHDKVYALIHIARTFQRLAELQTVQRADFRDAFAALEQASAIAESLQNDRALAYSRGNMAELYEADGRYEEALVLTRQAIAAAEGAGAYESLYRWHWQAGRVLWAVGQTRDALDAYRRAVDILQITRQETAYSYLRSENSFRDSVGPVYRDLVDGLLQVSEASSDVDARSSLLREARDTVEMLKAAELRDYFRDECVADLEARAVSIESVSADAAIVYPVFFPDRLELLVATPGGLNRYTTPVGETELNDTIRQFRSALQRPAARDYLEPSQQLYQWLIAPYEHDLEVANVTTLVFVPGGGLRTIPMAALHDGRDFVIRKYAVAVTPILALTDPQPLDRQEPKVLLAGISESVAGAQPLPYVPGELNAIQNLFGGRVLLDQDFTTENFVQGMGDRELDIVHIASHGVFTGDPDKSFLVTHDGRISMNQLSEYIGRTKFRETPLELLVLSACETAIGDDRAALGLAGVAINAGARSALGSLWAISDPATAKLIEDFYRQLQNPNQSRAHALRMAQLSLLDSEEQEFQHPYFWSAFLLISNWL